jgi:hypothetical protein
MKIKSWPLLLISSIIFLFLTAYWYLNNPEDNTGIIIFGLAGVILLLGALGNWISGK